MMNSRCWNVSMWLAAALALTLTAACGAESEKEANNDAADNASANNASSNNGTSNNASGNNTTANNASVNNGSGNNGASNNKGGEVMPPETYEDEYQFIFTRMAFLNEGATYKLLNNLIRDNLDQALDSPIIVLVDFQSVDPDGGTLEMRAGAGLKTETEGEYVWDPETPEEYSEGTIDPDTGRVEGVLPKFVFTATVEGPDETFKVGLPINELQFSGNLKAEGDGEIVIIEDGFIKGYITLEDGNNVELALVPGGETSTLTEILKEENLNHDSDDDGTNDAWMLEAEFTAAPTNIDQ